VPTIARLIHEELGQTEAGKKLEIALLPALPYFTYGDVGLPREITADPSAFLASTKQALAYYEKRNYLKYFKAIYLIGDEYLARMLKPAVGRRDQCNEPHYTELLAALGIAHFYHAAPAGASARPLQGSIFLSSRENPLKLLWNDLPMDESKRIDWEKKFCRITRFSVALRHCFEPTIKDVFARHAAYRAPWYRDFLEGKNRFDENEDKKLDRVKLYCDSFLAWLMDITRPNTEGFETRLFNRNIFSKQVEKDQSLRLATHDEFRLAGLEGLLLDKDQEKASVEKIWAKVCDAKVPDPPLPGVARALQAIYSNC
jgi:hypothetical protein